LINKGTQYQKLLLLLLFVTCAWFTEAQTIFAQNFEASQTSIPAGWSQQNPAYIPTNQGWKFDTTVHGTLAPYVARHTWYAYVNDVDNNASMMHNQDSLYTPSLNFTGYFHLFISYDVWFYGYYDSIAGDFEVASLAASTDGGHTWTQVDTVGCWGGISQWRTVTYDLSAFGNKPNVILAFTYDDLGHQTSGEAIDNINVYQPILYDAGVTSCWTWFLCKTGSSNIIQGQLYNYGADTIYSMKLKYSVNGGPVKTDNLPSVAIPPLTYYYYSHTIPWVPAVAGTYKIKIWADTLDGHADQNHPNDTLTAYFVVMDTIQRKDPLFEEFMQASCDPCMLATPNLDSVLTNNISIVNPTRYHVSWPGRDFINDVTNAHDANPRADYYNVQGVPDAKIDGIYDVYPGTVSSVDIQNAAALGSPFDITVNTSYSSNNDKYSVTANITAHAAMPKGIRARAVLTVDTMKYQQDQSQEDPPSSFASPIGTGTTPDSYYQYTLNFPNVVEDMMPDSNGTRLAAFAKGQTQVINFSWTKNHPWADSNKVWLYDSVGTHITVFLQNDSTPQGGGGAPTQYVYQSAKASVLLGMENLVIQETYFEIYPNPANSNVNLVFRLAESGMVNIKVYNILGEEIYSLDNGKTSTGLHNVRLNVENLNSGIYFVKLTTDAASSTKKLVIQK
jgi:hypothetical protein